AFWKGVIGSFMFFLPITLIITLVASLLVAYIINPVFAVTFMKPDDHHPTIKRRFTKRDKVLTVLFLAFAGIFYLAHSYAIANFIVFIYLFIILEKFIFSKWIFAFQNR